MPESRHTGREQPEQRSVTRRVEVDSAPDQADESPYDVILGLQRGAGNAAVARSLQRQVHDAACEHEQQRRPEAAVPLQRMPKEERPKRSAAASNPYSHQPRSERLREKQGYGTAPAQPARQLPARGPQGQPIWSGGRQDIGFTPEAMDAVHDRANQRTAADGVVEYECQECRVFVPRKRDTTGPRAGTDHTEIDHITGIIEYVWAKAEQTVWEADGGTVSAILREDAKRAANDEANLRILCGGCNGQRASKSGSRHMDQSKAVDWAG